MQLNDWHKAFARTYCNGDYAYVLDSEINRAELARCGDTLFVFLMIELSEA